MYITINNIKGEQRIDMSYSIQNFDSGKEIAVIRVFSDNVKVHITPLTKFRPENPCGVKRSHAKNFRNRTWRFPTIELF